MATIRVCDFCKQQINDDIEKLILPEVYYDSNCKNGIISTRFFDVCDMCCRKLIRALRDETGKNLDRTYVGPVKLKL